MTRSIALALILLATPAFGLTVTLDRPYYVVGDTITITLDEPGFLYFPPCYPLVSTDYYSANQSSGWVRVDKPTAIELDAATPGLATFFWHDFGYFQGYSSTTRLVWPEGMAWTPTRPPTFASAPVPEPSAALIFAVSLIVCVLATRGIHHTKRPIRPT